MSRKLNLKVVLASAAVAGAAMAVQSAGVRATTYTWTPTTGGSYAWTTTSNWSPNTGFPNATSDGAYLTPGIVGNQVISLGRGITLSALTLGSPATNGDGSNTYTVGGGSGNALTVGNITENLGSAGDTIAAPITGSTGSGNNLVITNSSAGTLTLSGKLTLSGGSGNYIQYDSIAGNAAGTLALDGGGSSTGSIFAERGTVSVSGGTLTAGGIYSVWAEIGGTFAVNGGAVTTTSPNGMLISDNGAGTLSVSSGSLVPGSGSGLGIYIANQGSSTTGSLNVTGGVLGYSSDLTKTYHVNLSGDAAASTTSNVNISGGNVYLNQIVMLPGASGANAATSNFTQTGGTVDVYTGNYNYIGGGTITSPATTPGTATMRVSGGTLSLGGIKLQAGGILNVNGTGSVDESQAMQLSTGGIVNLSGGILTTPEIAGASGGFTGTFNFTGGTLSMYNSSLSYDPITTANNTGTFTNSGGTLAVGGVGTTGKTLLAGNYDQTSGTLAIDIGGVNQGVKTNGYDLLDTTTADAGSGAGAGLVTLGGDLSVSLVNGFTPTATDAFAFLLSNGLSGAFANVAVNSRIGVIGGSGSFELLQSGNELYLSNFESTSIPEPATLGLLAMAGVGLLLMRPRRA